MKIDADGVVTTGPGCTWKIRYIVLQTFIAPSVRLPIGVDFIGATRFYLEATNESGECFADYMDVTVRHTLLDYLRWALFQN